MPDRDAAAAARSIFCNEVKEYVPLGERWNPLMRRRLKFFQGYATVFVAMEIPDRPFATLPNFVQHDGSSEIK